MLLTHIEWDPRTAAEELSGWRLQPAGTKADFKSINLLAARIREAILLGRIQQAGRRTYHKPFDDKPGDDYFIKPATVIEWALSEGITVPAEYQAWHESITRPVKRKPRPGGPREQTLYAVIAAMAKDIGYTPGDSSKSGQGKLKGIKRHTDLDEKTIREVITQALHNADNE